MKRKSHDPIIISCQIVNPKKNANDESTNPFWMKIKYYLKFHKKKFQRSTQGI